MKFQGVHQHKRISVQTSIWSFLLGSKMEPPLSLVTLRATEDALALTFPSRRDGGRCSPGAAPGTGLHRSRHLLRRQYHFYATEEVQQRDTGGMEIISIVILLFLCFMVKEQHWRRAKTSQEGMNFMFCCFKCLFLKLSLILTEKKWREKGEV